MCCSCAPHLVSLLPHGARAAVRRPSFLKKANILNKITVDYAPIMPKIAGRPNYAQKMPDYAQFRATPTHSRPVVRFVSRTAKNHHGTRQLPPAPRCAPAGASSVQLRSTHTKALHATCKAYLFNFVEASPLRRPTMVSATTHQRKSWRWAPIAVLAVLEASALAADVAVDPAPRPRPRDSVLAHSPQPSHDATTTGIPAGSPTHAPGATDAARRHGWTSTASGGAKAHTHAEKQNMPAPGLTGHTVR